MNAIRTSQCSIRLVLLAFLAMALGFFWLPQGMAADSRVLRVVMDDNYPPYSFRDVEGKLTGVLIDQWALWEKKTGVRVEISAMDWSDALSAMQAGRYDVIDTIFRNPEREKLYDFSQPHARLDAGIFFNKNISGISGISSLKGFSVGVKRGDHAVSVLKQAGINGLIEYVSYESMMVAARDKNLLVFVMDKPPAMYYIYKFGLKDEIRFSQLVYFGEFHRAVRKGDSQILKVVAEGFARIDSSEYDAIERKWAGSSPDGPRLEYWVLAAIFGVLPLAIALLGLWNWTLRRKVLSKTRALADSEEQYRELLTNLAAGVIVYDPVGNPKLWNTAALHALGLTEGQLTGKEPLPPGSEYISAKGDRLDLALFPVRIVLASGEPLRNYTMGIRQSDGTARWFQVDAFPDIITPGCIAKIVVTFFDITARRESEEKLLFISFHDALTGVYNRAYFEEELRRIDSRRSGSVAIAVADVDVLKRINDTWGHAKGDELLIRAAKLLGDQVRHEDVVARIGGDEFAVILRNAGEDPVTEIFYRLRQAMDKVERQPDEGLRLRISFGYAFAAGPGVAAADLFKEADNRMYQEKAKRHADLL